MAKQAVLAQYIALNSTDLTAYVRNGTLNIEVNAVESTTMGSNGWTENVAGLRSATLEFEVADDVAASAIDSILWPLLGTIVTFETRLNSTTVSTSNPKYTGSVLVNGHALGGSVGDLATKGLSFPVTGAVTRATA